LLWILLEVFVQDKLQGHKQIVVSGNIKAEFGEEKVGFREGGLVSLEMWKQMVIKVIF